MRFNELQNGANVEGHARVVSSSIERTKTGDAFWRMTLADTSGMQIPAIFWNREHTPPPARSIVRFRAFVKEFRDALNLTLTACDIDPGADASAYLPQLPPARRIASSELDTLIASIADSSLRRLVDTCFAGGERERFYVHPAAMKMHGAVTGGLLAHTVRVTRIAITLAELTVSPVDRSLLIAASILHDIGKLDELTENPGEEPTEDGRLLGHIVPAVIRITQASDLVPDLTEERRTELIHAVIGSHGKKEFGSPAVPATLEAVLIHLADESEATIEATLSCIEASPPDARWTEYIKSIDTRLRLPARKPAR
jgi:3'-5' exoribonuclease